LLQGTPRNMKVFFITLTEAIEGVPGIPQDFIFNAVVTHLDHFARGKEYMCAFCICERTLVAEFNVNSVDQTQHWPYDRELYEPCLISVALKPQLMQSLPDCDNPGGAPGQELSRLAP